MALDRSARRSWERADHRTEQWAELRAELRAASRTRGRTKYRTVGGTAQGRTGLFSTLRLTLPALADRLSPLALRTLSGRRRRAHSLAQGGRRLHFHPPFAAGVLCFVGEHIDA